MISYPPVCPKLRSCCFKQTVTFFQNLHLFLGNMTQGIGFFGPMDVIISRTGCLFNISSGPSADFVYLLVRSLYIHKHVIMFKVNIFLLRILKRSLCNLFILHILILEVSHIVRATRTMYVGCLLRHISKLSPIRENKYL